MSAGLLLNVCQALRPVTDLSYSKTSSGKERSTLDRRMDKNVRMWLDQKYWEVDFRSAFRLWMLLELRISHWEDYQWGLSHGESTSLRCPRWSSTRLRTLTYLTNDISAALMSSVEESNDVACCFRSIMKTKEYYEHAHKRGESSPETLNLVSILIFFGLFFHIFWVDLFVAIRWWLRVWFWNTMLLFFFLFCSLIFGAG